MDSDRVRLGPDGREMTEFIASYDCGNGLRQMIGVWAFSREDAKLRIQQMRQSLVFEGPVADFEPVEWEFRPSGGRK